jgi:hypothetical protein
MEFDLNLLLAETDMEILPEASKEDIHAQQ